MDNFGPRPLGTPEPRRRPLLKTVLGLILVIIAFGAGVLVGRQSHSASKTTAAIDYASVNQLYDVLKQDFDGSLKTDTLLDGLKHGLVSAAGDPYTTYFNPTEAKSFQEQLAGSFTGIGAELGAEQGRIVIISPLAGYPAAKAGLKPKDVVAAIDGKSTSGLSVDAAVAKIRGPAGKAVTLTIIRGTGSPFDVKITRATIKIASVTFKTEGQIGYMKISQFSDDTVALAQKAAKEFKAKSVKAVVLDLRGDPGGFLDGAVNVSSLWLDAGKTVVSERRGGQVTSTETAKGGNTLKGLPTMVLIDGGSASASEITAGALRDNSVATLIGSKSFGKGSVQKVDCLGDAQLDGSCQGAELKVTIARWYTPAGKNIDKQGIEPDVKVAISDADLKAGRDPQKARAFELLKQKIH